MKTTLSAPVKKPKNSDSMNELTVEDIRKQKEFETEMMPYLDAMYSFALRLTSDPDDAEDLVQESIVKAFRFFNSYEQGTNAKAWLFRILKNSFINDFRKQSKQPYKVDYNDIAPYYENVRSEQSNSTDLQSTMFREMLDDDMTDALAKLPEDFRIVVLLSDIEEFSYEEIANMLDVPIGTVRSRLHRGRNLLKTTMLDYATERGYLND
ncbi:MAG: sigma-70 family RNA polymerase sigma factor [Balneolales bacterium]